MRRIGLLFSNEMNIVHTELTIQRILKIFQPPMPQTFLQNHVKKEKYEVMLIPHALCA